MTTLTARALCLLTMAWCAGAPCSATGHEAARSSVQGNAERPGQSEPPSRASAQVRGYVTDADDGEPLRRALVSIASREGGQAITSATDEQGRYEFTGLSAGRYRLSASKNGYLGLSYGQRRSYEGGRLFDVRAGEVVRRDLSLPRGAVVTGRIVDEYGDPVPNVVVFATRDSILTGQKANATQRLSDTTDDLGEYRLYGVPPGSYYILAVAGPDARSLSDDDNRLTYPATYYPGATKAFEGRPLSITTGQNLTGIDIALMPTSAARILGTVVNLDGRPMESGIVSAFWTDVPFVHSTDGPIGPNGSFALDRLPPGGYFLRIQGTTKDGAQQIATRGVTLATSDIVGLTLAPEAPARVSGRLVFDSLGAMAVAPSSFRVTTTPAPVGAPMIRFGRAESSQVREDSTFSVRASPGKNLIRSSAPDGWAVKAIMLNGADIKDAAVELAPKQELRGIEIHVTGRPASVAGTVSDSRGGATGEYTAILFARDERRWTPNSPYVFVAGPDPNGRFEFKSVRPGDYLAVALEYVEPGRWTDPEFLNQIRRDATDFSIGEGETKILTLGMFEP